MRSPEKREQEHFERRVAVDEKHLGIETDELLLEKINSHFYKGFKKTYFRTASGNIYLIQEMAPDEKGTASGDIDWFVINGKENAGWERGKKINGDFLTEEDLKNRYLRVGEPFMYGDGLNTSEVSEIVLVDEQTRRGNLEELTQGRTNTITKDFVEMTQPQKK
ncbi:MAG: hypothetical protein A3G45_00145 [Candidatus Staskawiczbacteria bacterium RIFCSPLOWO2_12_FULL_37_15]|uniref:Uncharacterized protein n=1 Tax=Candidatus Staskawiczbacteria bacterium RIFCSPLOWO2_12_FULL_37_15 TaxID=1802218 RepID=A0A1G2IQM5_9BACT|nr:MAG: hypothetical protein US35_C0034G0001 [Parcubacteria group bacterium GW2011_GWA2_37_10]OGZ76680.1 MAG: hypothetical protein A3G45_00145 [Candidatus Staskawiczbacteria bacterium RIFCSPLOWO2_12_FULL_37_15]HLD38102.1 hypothetical protein [Candidatus Nanoarchaeia archaeon]